jgi:hypothetical protein
LSLLEDIALEAKRRDKTVSQITAPIGGTASVQAAKVAPPIALQRHMIALMVLRTGRSRCLSNELFADFMRRL